MNRKKCWLEIINILRLKKIDRILFEELLLFDVTSIDQFIIHFRNCPFPLTRLWFPVALMMKLLAGVEEVSCEKKDEPSNGNLHDTDICDKLLKTEPSPKKFIAKVSISARIALSKIHRISFLNSKQSQKRKLKSNIKIKKCHKILIAKIS